MYVLTDKEMREADAYTINELGVPSLTLMERAGTALADEAEKLAPSGKILCVCGGGNNGGDGFVCARILRARGRETALFLCGDKESKECSVNKEKWLQAGGEILQSFPKESYSLIVDCLFGTGFHGEATGEYAVCIENINRAKREGALVLSADIPSGVNGKNGLAKGLAVHADETLCIGEFKAGCLLADGLDRAGKVLRADIGIALPKKGYTLLVDEKLCGEILPKRKRNSHKGNYGKGAIVGGSLPYTGAAYLSFAACEETDGLVCATEACARAGVGYTTLFVPKGILPYYLLRIPEVLLKSLGGGESYAFDEGVMAELLAYDSIAYGMGMGVSQATADGAAYLLREYEGVLILDADGLNSLSAYRKEEFSVLFSNKKCEVVLTPHLKEFSRLCDLSVAEILEDGTVAKAFAEKYQVTVLLKNAFTVITDGKSVSLSVAGTSGQAKGGSGDVLSGVIAGLCAQGCSGLDGARLGAYLTGKAAEIAVEETGEYSLLASDVVKRLGKAFVWVKTHS